MYIFHLILVGILSILYCLLTEQGVGFFFFFLFTKYVKHDKQSYLSTVIPNHVSEIVIGNRLLLQKSVLFFSQSALAHLVVILNVLLGATLLAFSVICPGGWIGTYSQKVQLNSLWNSSLTITLFMYNVMTRCLILRVSQILQKEKNRQNFHFSIGRCFF